MNWFKKIADYHSPKWLEKYYDRVSEIASKKEYPFSKYFPEKSNRIYLPLIDKSMSESLSREEQSENFSQDDYEVIDFLKGNKCYVSDYLSGTCEENGRKIRIGKFLNNYKNKLEKYINNDMDEIAAVSNRTDIDNYQKNKYIDSLKLSIADTEKDMKRVVDLMTKYQNSAFRSLSTKPQSDLQVVISQDPHDIAKMSTDRGWISCKTLYAPVEDMNIEHRVKEVMCEAEEGGLIAYLINKSDKDIIHPFGRILLRRYADISGNNYLVPEEAVYGVNYPGFQDTVNNWISSIGANSQDEFIGLHGDQYTQTLGPINYSNFDTGLQNTLDKMESIHNQEIPSKNLNILKNMLSPNILSTLKEGDIEKIGDFLLNNIFIDSGSSKLTPRYINSLEDVTMSESNPLVDSIFTHVSLKTLIKSKNWVPKEDFLKKILSNKYISNKDKLDLSLSVLSRNIESKIDDSDSDSNIKGIVKTITNYSVNKLNLILSMIQKYYSGAESNEDILREQFASILDPAISIFRGIENYMEILHRWNYEIVDRTALSAELTDIFLNQYLILNKIVLKIEEVTKDTAFQNNKNFAFYFENLKDKLLENIVLLQSLKKLETNKVSSLNNSSWFKKISMPVVEDDPRYKSLSYLNIGHPGWAYGNKPSKYDFDKNKNSAFLWLVFFKNGSFSIETFELGSDLNFKGEDISHRDIPNNHNAIASGRAVIDKDSEEASSSATIRIDHLFLNDDYRNSNPRFFSKLNMVQKKVEQLLDKTFNNPAIVWFSVPQNFRF